MDSSTQPWLKFRFWCVSAGAYASDYRFSGCVDELFDDDVLVPQQCTGLKDSGGKWVFEGDIVKLQLGEVKECRLATVEREPDVPCNMVLVSRDGGGRVVLPLSEVLKGVVVGASTEISPAVRRG